MKKGFVLSTAFVLALVALVALSAMPAEAQERKKLFPRIGVQVNIPNPTDRAGRPITIGTSTTDGFYANRPGGTRSATVAASGAPEQSGRGGDVVYPDQNGRKISKPNLQNAVVGIAGRPGNRGVENGVYRELHKLRIPYLSGAACERRDGGAVVCFIVGEPRRAGSSSSSDSWSTSRSGDGRYSSSGSWSSGSFSHYMIVVEAWLYDGGREYFLGAVAREFTVPGSSHWSHSRSDSGKNRGSSSSGTNYSSGGNFDGEAARAARKAIEHLLKKDNGWRPEAARLVEEAFRNR